MEVHKLQGCGSRWRLRRFAALAISLESAAAVRPKLSQGLVLPLHAPKPFSGTKARFLCVPFHCCARKERSSVREILQWTVDSGQQMRNGNQVMHVLGLWLSSVHSDLALFLADMALWVSAVRKPLSYFRLPDEESCELICATSLTSHWALIKSSDTGRLQMSFYLGAVTIFCIHLLDVYKLYQGK